MADETESAVESPDPDVGYLRTLVPKAVLKQLAADIDMIVYWANSKEHWVDKSIEELRSSMSSIRNMAENMQATLRSYSQRDMASEAYVLGRIVSSHKLDELQSKLWEAERLSLAQALVPCHVSIQECVRLCSQMQSEYEEENQALKERLAHK